jgi:hypothetical protein
MARLTDFHRQYNCTRMTKRRLARRSSLGPAAPQAPADPLPMAVGSTDASGTRGFKPKNKQRRGRGPSGGSATTGGGAAPQHPPALWQGNYSLWTGMIQAWGMPLCAPAAGVLGPHPLFQARQAMVAHHQSLYTPGAPSSFGGSPRDTSALYTALNNTSVSHPPSQLNGLVLRHLHILPHGVQLRYHLLTSIPTFPLVCHYRERWPAACHTYSHCHHPHIHFSSVP